jgi:photosystem II stability/assembly factor-like uncharacterized protein
MKRLVLLCSLLAAAWPVAAQKPDAEPPEAAALKHLPWRSIGPANPGGRVTDIAGIPGDPKTFYGGLFKTTNGGTTFKELFTDQAVYSVGAIAIAPSDANVIWLGSGEGNPRNTASFGNGVYRSTDGGESWAHLGLDESERIARIRVDPRNPDVAYVAALGHAWGANEERGLFKTEDGGKTWKKSLYLDQDTGCSDVELDPSNPRIVYAGMYTYRRRPWSFSSGGGATALYKSTDGGQTWKKLTDGLPRGDMDRIGIAVSPAQPQTVYMITESKTEGVLFRSDDRGESWRMVHKDPNINFRPFYYSDIRVDPKDPDRVFSLSGGLFLSTDGGKTFQRIATNVHGDHQALWIDPEDPNRILSGSDGGFQVSLDGGRTFDIINNVVLSQFYHLAYDLRQPYSVCGGLQDNGNWCGPSATLFTEGIRKDDWYTVSGGDGFFVVPDLSAPHLVYSDSQGGNITLTDTRSGATRSIHPHPVEIGSSGNAIAAYKYRFNWNPPIVLSPHDPKTVYFGGNVVFKTTNYGQSWEVISPDLTTDDKEKQQSSGGPVVTDNTAAEFHCTILTIAESPLTAGVIWVGTDDGNIQVTRDGGKSWTNTVKNIPGLPARSWVPSIEASRFDAGTAYVAVDRHRDDDFAPYAFKTTDYGQTWKPIRGNLPPKGYLWVIREDPKTRNLLYAGTELGIFASWDGGSRWVSIRNNLPPVAVNDLAIHPRENDLIIGTHGRGAFILDDLTPLQQLATALAADAHLFDIRPATRYQMWSKDAALGSKTFVAENPPAGAMLHYFLKSEPKEAVTITVTDKAGKTVRTLPNAANQAGINRVAWDLRYDGPYQPAAERDSDFARFARRFGFGAGPAVVPGDYTVTVRTAGKEMSKTVSVGVDPRIDISTADLEAQLEAGLRLRELLSKTNTLIERTDDLTKQLNALAEVLKKAPPASSPTEGGNGGQAKPGGPGEAVEAALKELKELRDKLTRPLPGLNYRQAPRLREELNALSGAINRVIAPPTDPQKVRLPELSAETERALAEFNGIVTRSIGAINEMLSGSPRVVAGAPIQ